jgi:hypothetical protein
MERRGCATRSVEATQQGIFRDRKSAPEAIAPVARPAKWNASNVPKVNACALSATESTRNQSVSSARPMKPDAHANTSGGTGKREIGARSFLMLGFRSREERLVCAKSGSVTRPPAARLIPARMIALPLMPEDGNKIQVVRAAPIADPRVLIPTREPDSDATEELA